KGSFDTTSSESISIRSNCSSCGLCSAARNCVPGAHARIGPAWNKCPSRPSWPFRPARKSNRRNRARLSDFAAALRLGAGRALVNAEEFFQLLDAVLLFENDVLQQHAQRVVVLAHVQRFGVKLNGAALEIEIVTEHLLQV